MRINNFSNAECVTLSRSPELAGARSPTCATP